ARDTRVAQHPGEGELGEGLPTTRRDLIEGAGVLEVLVGDVLLADPTPLGGTRVARDAVEIPVGQHALGEGREHDAPGAEYTEHGEQPFGLDVTVEYAEPWLVDEQRNPLRGQRGGCRPRLLGGVVRDSDVERLAAARRLGESPHRLFDRRLAVGAVRV